MGFIFNIGKTLALEVIFERSEYLTIQTAFCQLSVVHDIVFCMKEEEEIYGEDV